MKREYRSIRQRYIASGLIICFISLIMASILSYMFSYRIAEEQSNNRMREAAEKNAAELNLWFQEYGKSITDIVEEIQIMGKVDKTYLKKIMQGKCRFYSLEVLDYYIGFENTNESLISGNGWVPDKDYDCRNRIWYTMAAKSSNVIYTEPYVDKQTGNLVVTAAKGIRINNKLVGVAAVDIYITSVINAVKKYDLGYGNYAFLLDSYMNVIVHKNDEFAPDGGGLKNLLEVDGGRFKTIISHIDNKKEKPLNIIDYDGKMKYFIMSKISSCGWIFGIAIDKEQYNKPLHKLFYDFVGVFFVAAICGIAIMYKLTADMVEPIKALSEKVKSFSEHNMSVRAEINTDDEIGDLGRNFNSMAETIQEYSSSLEKKVEERTKELKEKNDSIMESIDYAQRLQKAILPPIEERLKIDSDKYFVLWKPKDLVGGDIYWCRNEMGISVLVLTDCTGHGVPGALMTMAVNSILDGITGSLPLLKASEVLYIVNERLKTTLRQEEGSGADDGADMAVVILNPEEKVINFAGAHMSVFVCKGDSTEEYKGTRSNVGYSTGLKETTYEDAYIAYNEGERLYLATDGILDQNSEPYKGGLGRRGFMRIISTLKNTPIKDQGTYFENMIGTMLEKVDQRDDITIIGFEL